MNFMTVDEILFPDYYNFDYCDDDCYAFTCDMEVLNEF